MTTYSINDKLINDLENKINSASDDLEKLYRRKSLLSSDNEFAHASINVNIRNLEVRVVALENAIATMTEQSITL